MSIERELNDLIEQASPEGGVGRVLEEVKRESAVSWLLTRRDDRFHQAIERMRKNWYPWWKVLDELYLAPHSDPSRLELWRRAPQGSQEWRWAKQHDEALELLITAAQD